MTEIVWAMIDAEEKQASIQENKQGWEEEVIVNPILKRKRKKRKKKKRGRRRREEEEEKGLVNGQ